MSQCYPDATWPFTASGVRIERLETDISAVRAEGRAMVTIGEKMTLAATTLQSIADSSDGQQGKAVDKLREQVGDSYDLLGKAGEMYTPTGQAIVDYADALDGIKWVVNARQSTAGDLWQAYVASPGDKDGTSYPFGIGRPEEGSAEEAEAEAADEAARQAYEDWLEAAAMYESSYGDWEDAWNLAASEIEDAFDDDLEDGFWENLQVLGEVLSWVALVVGVAALIIGGPIAALVALAVGIAFLVVTVIQWAGGRKSLGDVAMAALGVLPFGKLAGLTKIAHLNKAGMTAFFKGGMGNFGKLTGLTSKSKWIGNDGLIKIFQNNGASAGFNKLLTGNKSFTDVYRNHKRFWEGAANAGIRNGSAVRNLAVIDYALGFGSNALGHYGRVQTVTNAAGADLPSAPPWLKVIL